MSPDDSRIPKEDLEGVRSIRPVVGPKIIATHTVKQDETLSDIALKYYGKAVPEYWNHIFNANKDVLKSADVVTPGTVLKIPEKP